jgi:chromosome segregation ATPase
MQVVTSKTRLVVEVQKLRQENADLRARLAAAHHAKQQAESQAEDLRAQKERLRVKAATVKKDIEAQRRVLEQVQEKNAALREELEIIKARQRTRRGPR